MGRTGRGETAASMIQNGELPGKVGLDPGPAHRSGHRGCPRVKKIHEVPCCKQVANAARCPWEALKSL
jgi:hypothetical protein